MGNLILDSTRILWYTLGNKTIISEAEEDKNMKELFGRYFISKNGIITSKITKVKVTGKQKVIAPFLDKDGYERVSLVTDEGRKKFRVCRLVAQVYVENLHNKPVVNHIDCNILNNYKDNLEWVTISENTIHAIKNGLIKLEERRDPKTGRFLSKSERSTTSRKA